MLSTTELPPPLLSSDGKVMLLTAGLKLLVVERGAADWSTWTTRLQLNQTNLVFDTGVLSDDGSVLAYGCTKGVCISVYNGPCTRSRSSA